MKYMRLLLLSASIMLVACTGGRVKPKPEGYYLPAATVGKPYHQVIELYDSIRGFTTLDTWPENPGLEWRFGDTESTTIEISGIPKNNRDKEIKVGIWGGSYRGMFDGDLSFYKEYMIKLMPEDRTPPAKP